MSDAVVLGLCVGSIISLAFVAVFTVDGPDVVRGIWVGFLDGVDFLTGGRFRRRAIEGDEVRVDIGSVAPSSCPNGPACPHDLDQHRYNPDRDHWDCTSPHCVENPEFTYPTIGTVPVRADCHLLHDVAKI